MTVEITQKAQITINWLRDPLTKGYIEFLKYKNDLFTKQVALIVENAIINGNKNRTHQEVSAFNQLKIYRESLEDLLPCFNLAHQEEELKKEDIDKLEDFFETLTKK